MVIVAMPTNVYQNLVENALSIVREHRRQFTQFLSIK